MAKKISFRADLRKPKVKTKKTHLEEQMKEQLDEAGLTGYKRNFRFIPKRRFEADFYFPELKLAVECDGGIWLKNSGHTSGEGYTKDRCRDQLALAHGIVTVRFTSDQIRRGEAIAYLTAYVPFRLREVELLQSNQSISMGFATQLPDRFGM